MQRVYTMSDEMLTALISGAIAVLSLVVSIYLHYWNTRDSIYDKLDDAIGELLRLQLQYPEYRDPSYCRNIVINKNSETNEKIKIEKLRYDAYAAFVWNMVETMYEKYGPRRLRKSSFYGALRSIGERHRHWLYTNGNIAGYDQKLLKFLNLSNPFNEA